MRYLVIITSLLGVLGLSTTFTSCDHVEIAYPPAIELDTTLYTGGFWSDYIANEWPDFDTISASPLRNAMIEDFTGHNCSNCPAAAVDAHTAHEANPNRVFVASIHSSNVGASPFQDVNVPAGYTINFTNAEGLYLGNYFGQIVQNSGFFGNPSGTVSRRKESTDLFYSSGFWGTKATETIALPLQVAIKSHVNYYDATKGFYLHTEVEILDNGIDAENLAMVAYLIEDSVIGPQNVQSTYTPDYVHRDIMRGTLSDIALGRDLTTGSLENGKYYLDYSYVVPDQLAPQGQATTYNVDNMHLLVYVHDKITHEIYQVVKQEINQ